MFRILSLAAAGLALALVSTPPAEASARKATDASQDQATTTDVSAQRRYHRHRGHRYRAYRGPRYRAYRGPRYRYARPYYRYGYRPAYGYRYARPYYRPYPYYYARPYYARPYVYASPFPSFYFGFGPRRGWW